MCGPRFAVMEGNGGLGNISTNEYSRAEPLGNKVELQIELQVHCQGLTTAG